MPVVSNTSPVLNLAIIEKLELLHQQCQQVIIPSAVLEELRIDEDLPGSAAIRAAIDSGWLQTRDADNSALIKVLQKDLDKGESEAIALALQINASLLLMDERDGRSMAKSLGIKVSGILGILCRAKQQGKNISLRNVMDNLRTRAGFKIHEKLYTQIIDTSGE